jgi:hypothetical protein
VPGKAPGAGIPCAIAHAANSGMRHKPEGERIARHPLISIPGDHGKGRVASYSDRSPDFPVSSVSAFPSPTAGQWQNAAASSLLAWGYSGGSVPDFHGIPWLLNMEKNDQYVI